MTMTMSMSIVYCLGRVFSKRDRLYFLLLCSFLTPSCVVWSPPPLRPAELLVQRRERETCLPPATFKLLGGGSKAKNVSKSPSVPRVVSDVAHVPNRIDGFKIHD
jgi:hypothetical protein